MCMSMTSYCWQSKTRRAAAGNTHALIIFTLVPRCTIRVSLGFVICQVLPKKVRVTAKHGLLKTRGAKGSKIKEEVGEHEDSEFDHAFVSRDATEKGPLYTTLFTGLT